MAAIFAELFSSFVKIGFLAFGGGYAMISLIAREVVTVKGWLDMAELIDVVAISQGTPGPVAINAATYIGFKVAGIFGAIVSTIGVVLPSFIIMSVLGRLLLNYRKVSLVQNMLNGIKPIVVVLILSAAASVYSTSITGVLQGVFAVVSILAVLFLNVNPILLLTLSGITGLILYR